MNQHRSSAFGPRKRRRARPAAALAAVTASLVVGACGGAGSDAGSSNGSGSMSTSLDVSAAYRSLTETARVAALAGSTDSGASAVGTLGVTPGQTALVTPLGTVDVSAIALSSTTANASPVTDGATYWFVQNGADWLASFSADGSCSIATSVTPLPASAAPGQSGAHIAANHYAACTSSSLPTGTSRVIGTVSENWSYDTASGTPYFCIQTVGFGTFASSSTQICAAVLDPAAGTLGTQLRVTLKDLDGVTTTLTN